MRVLQRSSKDLNSMCHHKTCIRCVAENRTGHALENHRMSRDDLSACFKAAQQNSIVIPYSPIYVLRLTILDTCYDFTVMQVLGCMKHYYL